MAYRLKREETPRRGLRRIAIEELDLLAAELSDPALDPYELILAFGVPDDAEGPFWVEVSPAESMPRLARFSIDP